jgi:hypothetical protein
MNASAEMPRYRCHKEVHALKIAEVHYFSPAADTANHARLLFEDDRYASMEVTPEWVAKHDPKAGGYFVAYEDGYTSFSPAEAFESGYTRIEK